MGEIQERIMKAIQILLNSQIEDLPYDRTLTGKIIADNGDGTFNVEIEGRLHTLKSREGLLLSPNDIVYVRVPLNKKNYKYIDMRRP